MGAAAAPSRFTLDARRTAAQRAAGTPPAVAGYDCDRSRAHRRGAAVPHQARAGAIAHGAVSGSSRAVDGDMVTPQPDTGGGTTRCPGCRGAMTAQSREGVTIDR